MKSTDVRVRPRMRKRNPESCDEEGRLFESSPVLRRRRNESRVHAVRSRVDHRVARSICIDGYVARRWKGIARWLRPKGDGMGVLGIIASPLNGLPGVNDHRVPIKAHYR